MRAGEQHALTRSASERLSLSTPMHARSHTPAHAVNGFRSAPFGAVHSSAPLTPAQLHAHGFVTASAVLAPHWRPSLRGYDLPSLQFAPANKDDNA